MLVMDVDLTPAVWGEYSRFHKKIKRGRGGHHLVKVVSP